MGSSDTAAKKEDGSPGSPQKEFTTKAEYNRWLVSQEKWQTAEEMRSQGKAGEEIIKERQRRHTSQGLARQQAAAVQMKKASESLEAHREVNLTLGRAVYEEVAGWRVGAKATKDDWASYGKNIKEAQIKNNATKASVAALNENKKAQAAATRKDDEEKAAARTKQKDEFQRKAREQAEKVRSETSDDVTDSAKRIFYEQRLKSAQETKADAAKWAKDRKEEHASFQEAQNKRRVKSKTARDLAGKSRKTLLTSRAEEAAQMRVQKQKLAEEHKQRLQLEYQNRAATVKGVIANSFLSPEQQTGEPGSPTALSNSFYSLTNIRPPSPERANAE